MRKIAFFTISLLMVVTLLSSAKQDKGELSYVKLFTEVYQLVKEKYVESVSPKKLFEGAIQGLLSKLDAHSTLFTPDQLKNLK